jgi:hypothetical protein
MKKVSGNAKPGLQSGAGFLLGRFSGIYLSLCKGVHRLGARKLGLTLWIKSALENYTSKRQFATFIDIGQKKARKRGGLKSISEIKDMEETGRV